MRYPTVIFCAVLVLFSLHQAQAKIIHVPADSSTIQKGINGAINGDTVLVARSHYYERIDFLGKAILVASNFIFDYDTTTIDSTIIDGEGSGSVVTFSSGENVNSIIEGFTITNGHATTGGGIWCRLLSSPTISNNIITNNFALAAGGGIDCDVSSPTIDNNVISNNSAGSGGGINCVFESSPLITSNTITGNTSREGGGIYCLYASPTISSNIIAHNSADFAHGGGIMCFDYSSPVITDNTITSNSAAEMGGGICCYDASPTISNNIISNNTDGEGIASLYGSYPVVSFNDVWNNANGNFYGCPAGVGDTTWGTNSNGTPCDSFYNIIRNPIFCYPEDGNYYLWLASPCVGAGQGGSDIGAFGIGCDLVGDANADGMVDIADVVYLINYLFTNGPASTPLPAGDVNCDGQVNIADAVYLLNYLFANGPPPCEP